MPAARELLVDPARRLVLEQLRLIGDPALDDLDDLTTGAPAVLAQMRLPDWADEEKLRRAAAVFRAWSAPYALLLGSVSLLQCFAAARGVQSLERAGVLTEETQCRVGRTSRFVLTIFRPGAFEDGTALRAIAGVRMVHAGVRRRLLTDGPAWDVARLGVPICQEDQAGTLLAFGISPLLHLRKLGATLSRREVNAVLHLWAVVGATLGLPRDLLAEDEASATAMLEVVRVRQLGPSAAGRRMTAQLLDAYRTMLPGSLWPLYLGWLRATAGDELCDWLAVPNCRWQRHVARAGVGLRAWQALARLAPALHTWAQDVAAPAMERHAERLATGQPHGLQMGELR